MVTSEVEGKYVPTANGCWARTRPGFKGTNKTHRRCLSLWSLGAAGEMDRVNAVGQVAINAMRENKVGVEAAIIISRVVRKGHTEKVASEQRRRGEGNQPFRHWEESVPSRGEGRHQGPEAEGCLACRKVSVTRGT